VWIDGETDAAARLTILDENFLQPGWPIWVRMGDGEDTWKQGTIARVAYATIHVSLPIDDR
jgi:hypothetical protein